MMHEVDTRGKTNILSCVSGFTPSCMIQLLYLQQKLLSADSIGLVMPLLSPSQSLHTESDRITHTIHLPVTKCVDELASLEVPICGDRIVVPTV